MDIYLTQLSDLEAHILMNNVPRKKPRQPRSLVPWNGDMVHLSGGTERCRQKDGASGVVAQRKTPDFGAERELDKWVWLFIMNLNLSSPSGTCTLKRCQCISDGRVEDTTTTTQYRITRNILGLGAPQGTFHRPGDKLDLQDLRF